MGAQDNFSHAAVVFAAGHDIFEVAGPGAPNISIAAAEFFKSALHHHVGPDAVQNRPVGLIVSLRLHRLLVNVLRKSKLARHQVAPGLERSWWRRGVDQRRKKMRAAGNLSQQRSVARNGPSHSITSLRVTRKDPEHRA